MKNRFYFQAIEILPLVTLVLLTGCSRRYDGPPLFRLTGVVQLDGEPMENGTISFVPVDGMGGAYGTEITHGKFTLKLTAGAKTVSVDSYRLSSTLLGPDGKPAPEQYLPSRYNRKSELLVNIGENEPKQLTFDLNSRPQ